MSVGSALIVGLFFKFCVVTAEENVEEGRKNPLLRLVLCDPGIT